MPRFLRLLPLLLATHAMTAHAADSALTTVSERSGFLKTGRYQEVIALCDAFAKSYPQSVRCIDFGTSPEGRPMKALVASTSGVLDAQTARSRGLPVVLIQGGIHAGEIDGKDAGFLALRELLDGSVAKGALGKLTLVFVPVFNVDGHERFGAWNRPNQRGPKQMGWRTTAQNFNLNRDYMKADAPEMQAMLRLIGAWDPIVYADLHVTNGAQFEHDISINIEPLYSGDDALRKAGRGMRDALLEKLSAQGSLPLPFYPSFVDYDNPASGFEDGVATPRFSHGYMPLRNRFGVLVETHSWKDYATRVRATRNTIIDLVELTATNGRQWHGLGADADARAARLGGHAVALAWKASAKTRMIDFRGYAYTRTPSEVSGALMTRYDENVPQLWKVPLRDDVQPSATVVAPRAGYIVPPAHAAWVSRQLELHGIAFRTLDSPATQAAVQTFRASKVTFAAKPIESHMPATFDGAWTDERRDVAAGSLYVPIGQPGARVVVAMLEPQAPDSLAAWGNFNGAFERKEYMEDYVAESVAREMLAKDPALTEAFTRKLAEDKAFAADPQARLAFFARRHSSWDDRLDLYPILRIDVEPGR